MSNIRPSKYVVEMLGDTLTNKIFKSDHIELYTLVDPSDSTKKKTVFEFKEMIPVMGDETDTLETIKEMLVCDSLYFSSPVKLDSDSEAILRFMLADESMYLKGDVFPSAPFIPEYMIQFVGADDSVQMLVSLTGGVVKVYDNNMYVKAFKYLHEATMLRYLSWVTEDESLMELLNLQNFN